MRMLTHLTLWHEVDNLDQFKKIQSDILATMIKGQYGIVAYRANEETAQIQEQQQYYDSQQDDDDTEQNTSDPDDAY